MNDHNFEFYLPAGAKIQQVQASAPTDSPSPPKPSRPRAEKNRYAIAFPLRPGETQFQLEFTLPYTGSAKSIPSRSIPPSIWSSFCPRPCTSRPRTSAFNR